VDDQEAGNPARRMTNIRFPRAESGRLSMSWGNYVIGGRDAGSIGGSDRGTPCQGTYALIGPADSMLIFERQCKS